MILKHEPFKEAYRKDLLNLWKASVLATHTFLSEPDVEFYNELVEKIEFDKLNTHLVFGEDEQMLGFWGTKDQSLLMLFLSPACIGKGIGKAIMKHIEVLYELNSLEVNEQNTGAVTFYQKMGYEITARKPQDDFGKPYPILKMKRI